MGALDEGQFDLELKNEVKLGRVELRFEGEPETIAIEESVKVLLQGLGEDVNREGLRKTPLRVAKAFREATKGYKQKVKDIVQGALFPEVGLDNAVGHAGGSGGLVIVRDLDLFSYCESCLLPFHVKCHVGYVPSGLRVVGLSKLSRVADVFAKRLQHPQRLADEVCLALHNGIRPAGVAVILQCSHIHFPIMEPFFFDSNHQGWVKALIRSGSGVFENENADIWVDFLSLLKLRDISADKFYDKNFRELHWCPSCVSSNAKISSELEPPNTVMVAAVTSILRSLGEDPQRIELLGTPSRFIKWLIKFQTMNLDMKLNGFICGHSDHKPKGEVCHFREQIHSELNLAFWSQCEHHLLPFYGVVHIGYFHTEGSNPIAKSLLQSVVHFYGFKLQVQERLTRQIAETVSSLLGGDVMVVVEASHTCMISRGIEKLGSSTATFAVLGQFSTDPTARAMFLQSIPNITAIGSS
ncbi:hypothetical protein K2173_018760 [Erythroxylum novogranatense]|uniref:GTP cyclohydrolase 1 n=1 Tax=Erythroxylum novogranatense TaxID=1862640 RepID=A0AAV8SBC6_9ROSI|nr:hypothetical protein K2173_018760 [Erythroxylum novogranatense]